MIGINIVSLNINGAREQSKRAKLYGLLKQKHIDVVMLQETHSDISNAADWVKEWDGLVILSHNTSLSGGVALLFARIFYPLFLFIHSQPHKRHCLISESSGEEIVELQRLEATGDRGHIEAPKSKKAKMNYLLDITAQGALVRSRFKSAAEMDAPSNSFSV
ncbi:hypothetical protein QTP70_028477 [Hemibagrus guttatus]|uniref:Endonuclease/exonuclease/phosphatase domain-containing protein n=1 Tax=Hemibagrus guttatus TaxID=175788 RepID=A0AAE0VGB1_9TELE|nr:hypothetical protein QTP70_028477 [Hemibagrus guttatus]